MRSEYELLRRLSDVLPTIPDKIKGKYAFTGFDGFVDTLQRAVRKRQGSQLESFTTIHQFADHLQTLSGKSGQVEVVTKKTKMGGNAPILANALTKLDVQSICVGAMGSPVLDSHFSVLPSSCELISLLPPGISTAIEFSDGKLILSDFSAFNEYTWSFVKNHKEYKRSRKKLSECVLFALVDWTNLLHASDLWQGFLDDEIKSATKRDRIFFFDLCDPSRKSKEEVKQVLRIISSFSQHGQVVLGLNENEATKVWQAIQEPTTQPALIMPSLHEIGSTIQQFIRIDIVLIHPRDRSLAVKGNGEIIELQGHVVLEPAVLTGGGDNLNAGFCTGLLACLSIEESMLLGMATSGSYVKNGASPTFVELQEYITAWIAELKPVVIL
jgi:hypothetical protein